jgi:hypothetical protein
MNNYYFNWKKFDKNGTEDRAFSPVFDGSKVGAADGYYNAIKISNGAVDSRAIFTVEVTKVKPD